MISIDNGFFHRVLPKYLQCHQSTMLQFYYLYGLCRNLIILFDIPMLFSTDPHCTAQLCRDVYRVFYRVQTCTLSFDASFCFVVFFIIYKIIWPGDTTAIYYIDYFVNIYFLFVIYPLYKPCLTIINTKIKQISNSEFGLL